MALTEKSRNAIYQSFRPQLGEEATQEMLSYFPARDVEEPATKGDIALVKADIALLRAELHAEIAGLRAEMHHEIGELRAEMHKLHNRTVVEIGALIAAAGLINHFLG
jgi:hypothetical protein